MFTIYWSSIVVGLVFGLAIGIAVCMWATWKVETEMNFKNGSDFARGFDKGWQSGIDHLKVEEALHRPIKQEGR